MAGLGPSKPSLHPRQCVQSGSVGKSVWPVIPCPAGCNIPSRESLLSIQDVWAVHQSNTTRTHLHATPRSVLPAQTLFADVKDTAVLYEVELVSVTRGWVTGVSQTRCEKNKIDWSLVLANKLSLENEPGTKQLQTDSPWLFSVFSVAFALARYHSSMSCRPFSARAASSLTGDGTVPTEAPQLKMESSKGHLEEKE